MDKLATILADVEPFKLNYKIIEQVVAQLQKDFDDIEVKVEITDNGNPYLQLCQAVVPIVDWLLEKRPERLFALFYRIDIPEQTVKALLVDPEVSIAQAYTDLILNRELQKVIIRNFYSNQL